MKQALLFLILLITTFGAAQYKNKSIGFTENKGQIIDQKGKSNPAVKYLLNSNGLNVQIKKNGFSYDVYETNKHPLTEKQKAKLPPSSPLEKDKKNTLDYSLEYLYHRVDIDFLNSNPKVELIAEEKSTDYDNYYNVPNKPEGVLMVHKYKQITYKNIYPNIDVVFTIPKDSLKTVEYNFVVHPKGKISDIQLKFSGAKTDLVDNKIKMQVRFGAMEETLPMSWIEDGSCKKEIAVGYKKIKNNVYGFDSAENVSNKTVVIDPVPTRLWGTYYGDIYLTEEPNSINLDNLGNTIFTGSTESSTNIATSGSFQSNVVTSGTLRNGFIAKLNSLGVRIWGTYLLNAGIQTGKINSQNEIYIGGYARATYPGTLLSTPNSFKEIGDTSEALLMKFDSNGQRIWGTFYGGLDFDRIDTISLDSQENIIIAGETHSLDNMTTPDAYQNTLNNSSDAYSGFFAKFNKDGNRLYGSYFPIVINRSTVDSNDNVIFGGNQNNDTVSYYPNISTNGAFKTNHNSIDGFIIKFDINFKRLWCTYFGGDKSTSDPSENKDLINGIGTDNANNIYIVGTTTSTNNITTPGTHKTSQNIQGQDAFVAKFSPNGIRQWGTYFGDNSTLYTDSGINCFITPEGNIYLVGYTDSQNNIATTNSFQNTVNGLDSYIAKFSTNGALNWSTYYGGKGGDFLKSIDYLDGKIVVSGRTVYDDSSYLGTSGTHKENGGGFIDIFIAEFQECLSNPLAKSNSPICIGNTLELKASGGTNYSWTGPNGFTSTDQNPTILNATAINSGQYYCAITGTSGCDDTKNVDVLVGDTVAPIPDITTLPTITGDCKTIITTIPTATDACAGLITATTTNPLSYSSPGTYTIVWKYDDGNGNSVTQNQTVIISSQPLPTINTPQTFCIQQNATLNSISIIGQNLKWYDALTNGNSLVNTTLLQNGLTYYASQTINGCESEKVPVLINIQNTAVPTANNSQSFCSTQNATLNDIAITGTSIKWYSAAVNGMLLLGSTALQNGITYFANQTINACESANRIPVAISLINTLNATNYAETICDDQNNGNEILNLSSFNPNLIASTTKTFRYYTLRNGAENQILANQINNYSNYNLTLGQTTFYVRIDSPNTCYQIVELQLTLVSKPIIPIPDIVPICEQGEVTIDAGAGADDYLWSNGAKTATITVLNPGNYSVLVTNNYGTVSCSSTKNFTVKKSDKPSIASVETKDWTDKDNVITVYLNNTGDFEYAIDGVNYQDSNQFLNVASGEYTVSVRDKNGCGQDDNEVYVLMYPKFFTPNGDGYNDNWKIKFSDFEIGLTVKIFDRYGKLIKNLITNTDSWDGNLKGANLPASDYWFVVTRANGQEYKGHFSLKR